MVVLLAYCALVEQWCGEHRISCFWKISDLLD